MRWPCESVCPTSSSNSESNLPIFTKFRTNSVPLEEAQYPSAGNKNMSDARTYEVGMTLAAQSAGLNMMHGCMPNIRKMFCVMERKAMAVE